MSISHFNISMKSWSTFFSQKIFSFKIFLSYLLHHREKLVKKMFVLKANQWEKSQKKVGEIHWKRVDFMDLSVDFSDLPSLIQH